MPLFVVVLLSTAVLLAARNSYPHAEPFTIERVNTINAMNLALTCDQQRLFAWDCTWCQLVNGPVKVIGVALDSVLQGEARAYVAVANKTIYTIFQGSHNAPNWVYDFDFPRTPYPLFKQHFNVSVGVHRGFYYAWKYVNPQIVALVNKALQHDCKGCTEFVVSGHSFGAALSVFQALDFRLNPPIANAKLNVSIWNMGQPRVGDQLFANTVMNNDILKAFYRCTHIYDPVPHLPFTSFGFFHAGLEVYNNVYNGTSYKVCDGSGEDPTCSDSIPASQYDVFAHLMYFGLDSHFGPHVCDPWDIARTNAFKTAAISLAQ